MRLNKKQTICLDFLEDKATEEIVFGGGAGGGKSVIGAYWVAKNCLRYPGTRWLLGRAVLKTLKETTLNSLYWVLSQQGVKSGKHFKYNDNAGLITFINGSQIILKDLRSNPSDPNFDELGSLEITGGFIDECNQTSKKAWEVVKSRIRYRLDEYGLIPKLLGTCNPAKNWVYADFFAPDRKGVLSEKKRFIQALVTDNPDISKHYYQNLVGLTDQALKQRLLYGNWDYDDDPAVLIDYDAITDVFLNSHVQPGNHRYLSADLAMQGRDRFVVGSWAGFVCRVKIDKLKAKGKEIEMDLKKLMVIDEVPHTRVVVDSDGLGAYLESYLTGIKEFHGNATPGSKEFANLKSECGFKLAEMINKRELRIICSPEQQALIAEELGVLKKDNIDGDENKKRIIKKEAMKELLGRSPDYLDMLLMRMRFEVKKGIKIYE